MGHIRWLAHVPNIAVADRTQNLDTVLQEVFLSHLEQVDHLGSIAA